MMQTVTHSLAYWPTLTVASATAVLVGVCVVLSSGKGSVIAYKARLTFSLLMTVAMFAFGSALSGTTTPLPLYLDAAVLVAVAVTLLYIVFSPRPTPVPPRLAIASSGVIRVPVEPDQILEIAKELGYSPTVEQAVHAHGLVMTAFIGKHLETHDRLPEPHEIPDREEIKKLLAPALAEVMGGKGSAAGNP